MNNKKFFLYLTVLTALSTLTISCQDTLVTKDEHVYDQKTHIAEELPVQDIRVLLHKDVKDARLAIHSPFKVSRGGKVIARGNILYERPVRHNNGKFSIGEKTLAAEEIEIAARDDGAIELNGIRYHGRLLLLPAVGQGKRNDRFSVVELTEIEKYLAGVIGSEMPQSWGREALRAQAVTARTYALYQRVKRRDDPYHIKSLGLAYQGLKKENEKLSRIVEETRGMVMLHNNQLFPAYFHSTCGGRTEDANLVFLQDGMPPLSGVKCGFCTASKYYNWQAEIEKKTLEIKLRPVNPGIKNISKVQPMGIGPGNHSSMVRICYAGGKKEDMSSNKFRLLVGSEMVRSTAFNARSKRNTIKFSGRGWGHGVGLCQYGAHGMAENGYQWPEILRYYYPEIEIKKIY